MKKNIFNKNLIAIILIFATLSISAQGSKNNLYGDQVKKMEQLMWLLNYQYVDSVNLSKLTEKGISEMLKELDPHSVYISKENLTRTNEPLIGNFEGIGIQYQIFKDTLTVVQTIKGGPSEIVGLLPGDKILKIDDSVATGKICTNDWVFKKLRGKKGTKVIVEVKRGKEEKPLVFTIIRDKIPINSIDAYFMIDKKIGYIKLDRFSQTTHSEFVEAILNLQQQGMESLIFDLRGNSGGYLNIAIEMVDELIAENNRLIVYTKNNQTGDKVEYKTKRKGIFEHGKLVILIDEYSASASEIVSGAVQDWDRGVIVGRRSFGKGLVQSQIPLRDGSALRLTTSKYYIPSGRCIQKPYEGVEDYSLDAIKRYNAGELTHADSIHFPDSLKFYTANKRIVYGGGGIMPDIFVPIDTVPVSDFYWKLFRNNIFNQFSFNYLERNKNNILEKYKNFSDFYANFEINQDILNEFYDFAQKEDVSPSLDFDINVYLKGFLESQKDTLKQQFTSYASLTNNTNFQECFQKYVNEQIKNYEKRQSQFDTETYIKRQLKTLIARNLYSLNESTKIWLDMDETYKKALEIIKNDFYFKKNRIK